MCAKFWKLIRPNKRARPLVTQNSGVTAHPSAAAAALAEVPQRHVSSLCGLASGWPGAAKGWRRGGLH